MKNSHKLLSLFLCGIIILSIFFTLPIKVSASGGFTSVDSISNPKQRNAYKIWSVAICAGLSKEAAAGWIGNAERESQIDSTLFEGWLDYRNQDGWTADDKALYVWNDKKSDIAESAESLCYYTVNFLFPYYASNGWGLEASQDDHISVAAVQPNGTTHLIHTGAYIGDGHYMPGIGHIQFTGVRASNLMNYASQVGERWYDLDTQLVQILRHEGNYQDGHSNYILGEYANITNVEEAANKWKWVVEGCGNNEPDTTREEYARAWFTLFENCKPDIRYARMILKKANVPFKYKGLNYIKTIEDKSAIQELSGRAIQLPQSTGFAFDVGGTADKYAEDAAIAILKSIPSYVEGGEENTQYPDANGEKKYSLYDLFGSDLHFYRYYGEATQPIQLLDHIFSAYTQDMMNSLTIKDTIFYTTHRYLSCNVYEGRPQVLTNADIQEGQQDPRVSQIETNRFNGSTYVRASFRIEVAKYITALVSFLMGDTVISTLRWVADKLTDFEIWNNAAVPIIKIIVGIMAIFFVWSLVKHAINYATGKRGSIKHILTRFFTGVIAVALILVICDHPKAFTELIYKSATVIDNVFESALTEQVYEDDVVGSTDGTKTIEAMLWRITVFEPWCKGQFGRQYDELYTQFADVEDAKKMPQSYIPQDADLSQLVGQNGVLYDSANYTGDVIVPVGNSTYIRNWAAYLYSCQSKYHIDYNYMSGKDSVPTEIKFPTMYTTAQDTTIAADTFRVLDAQMNISPQIDADGNVKYTYSGSKILEPELGTQSGLMVTYSLILLISFAPAIFMKLKNLLMLFVTFFSLIYHSIVEVAKENQGFSDFGKSLKKYFVGYCLACLKLFILVIAFNALVGQGIIKLILYGLLVLVVYGINLNEANKEIKDRINRAKAIHNRRVKHIGNRF